ncbi:hypothetical protein BON30_26925 [Cystobacter ferrugineus]|uniref:Amidohydrolase-related domain-containing protein n=2 Tax=Cystobacter ferrugineus TaxID=83449 RepID=A0A1L9B6E2_9BACT|nr:hypothetical protein BON30_26925 [Cystobacter ferrugineus]
MGVVWEPVNLVSEAAQPENIDTVVVAGRVLKRHGRLTALEPEHIISESAAAARALRARTGWR